MKIILLAAFTTCALGLGGCQDGNSSSCSQTVTEPAASVAGPKTVAVNQSATYVINYTIKSPCGKSSGPLDQAQGNTRYVGVQVVYDGCNCPQGLTPSQANYTFTPTQAGTYFLKFNSGTNVYITDTLVAK